MNLIELLMHVILSLNQINVSSEFGISVTSRAFGCRTSCDLRKVKIKPQSMNSVPDDFISGQNDHSTMSNIEILENELVLIEAIEERNKAQIYSFIDEQDQWDNMEESERDLLLRKDSILQQLQQYYKY